MIRDKYLFYWCTTLWVDYEREILQKKMYGSAMIRILLFITEIKKKVINKIIIEK